MKEFLKTVISTGNYKLSDMETRIKKLFALGDLSEEDMTELLALAAENAKDSVQIDMVEKLKELEDRIYALEHPTTPDFVVWYSGYVTAKGETVKYDVDGDGTMELCRYDGGRASTSLRPFKIDGWHIVDAQGNIIE